MVSHWIETIRGTIPSQSCSDYVERAIISLEELLGYKLFLNTQQALQISLFGLGLLRCRIFSDKHRKYLSKLK